MKVKVSILIDKETYEKAHNLGINVSKACENYLKQLTNQIETTNTQNLSLTGVSFAKEKPMVRLPGFEPGSSTWQGSTVVNWSDFETWLRAHNYRGSGTATKLSYATRYHGFLFRGELGKLSSLSPDSKANALKALSSLSKFMGCYDAFRKQMKDFGLTWGGKSSDKIFIERLTRVHNSGEIFGWIRTVKDLRPQLTEFLDLMAISGLRMIEAVSSYNMIVTLSSEGCLNKYYNEKNNSLEHFRFEETFIRKSKKAFMSFIPPELVKAISENVTVGTSTSISKAIYKDGLKPRFSDIRENHGSFMVKYLKPSEIDFLHGRVTSSVFMANYFNPALIADLKERALQGVAAIQKEIKLE